jgi:hypothetical protein
MRASINRRSGGIREIPNDSRESPTRPIRATCAPPRALWPTTCAGLRKRNLRAFGGINRGPSVGVPCATSPSVFRCPALLLTRIARAGGKVLRDMADRAQQGRDSTCASNSRSRRGIRNGSGGAVGGRQQDQAWDSGSVPFNRCFHRSDGVLGGVFIVLERPDDALLAGANGDFKRWPRWSPTKRASLAFHVPEHDDVEWRGHYGEDTLSHRSARRY